MLGTGTAPKVSTGTGTGTGPGPPPGARTAPATAPVKTTLARTSYRARYHYVQAAFGHNCADPNSQGDQAAPGDQAARRHNRAEPNSQGDLRYSQATVRARATVRRCARALPHCGAKKTSNFRQGDM